MIARCNNTGTAVRPRPRSPNEVAKAITGRDYLSYSQVTTYQACTLKWFFTYVESAKPEAISAPMLLGGSVHVALQHHLERQLAAEKPPTIDELMEVFQGNWKKEAGTTLIEYSREENAESQADLARRMLEAFLASPYSKPEGQTLGIEETLRVSLHPEIPDLLAKVDHIAGVNNELVVTDFKTARSMWNRGTAEGHAQQLHLYAEAVQAIAEDFAVPVKLRFIILTKAKSPRVESIAIKADPSQVRRSILVIRRVFQAMQTGVVYPSPSTMNCSGCPYQRRCDEWGRKI